MNTMNQLTNNEPETVAKPVTPAAAPEGSPKRALGAGLVALLLIAAAALGWFVYKGISTRVSTEKALVVETHDAAVLTVSVTHPKETPANQELVLPGNTQ